jgi:diguanylate cyclase (GGDEF)-like protein
MSFRGRLSLFFTIIVIVPMIAVALVLFAITAESERGKADARVAEGMRVAFALYEEAVGRAEDELTRVAEDAPLIAALRAGRARDARRRMAELIRADPAIQAIAFYGDRGERVARVGAASGIASAGLEQTERGGRPLGTLAVSVTSARTYAARVKRLTGLEVRLSRGRARLESTLAGPGLGSPGSGEVEIRGHDYRGRLERIDEVAGPPLQLTLLQDSDELSGSIADSRLLIGAILLAFLLLALASTAFVVRSLQRQIGEFLEAAKRLARGDFAKPVPTHGQDEFAALGTEFNSMSDQLETQIREVERKRGQLEETIRRVGDALAAGLDRQGVVQLAVETAVEACEATAGRALSMDGSAIERSHRGPEEPSLIAALEAAEKEAVRGGTGDGGGRLGSNRLEDDSPEQRLPAEARRGGVHALAARMRSHRPSGAAGYSGVVSIVRRDGEFTDSDRELLAYLARQAAVSIENVDLHETVRQQAVTDELTGLSNLRQFHATMDREAERSRRFESPLALVMLDLDDFKRVNDTYGHQQGDEALAEVARVMRELSRDIDEPARYGGEEFAVVLPQTDAEGALRAAERMRSAIERLKVPRIEGDGSLAVTASFGIASIPESAADKQSLIAAADAALLRAKRAGKNLVQRAEAETAPR